MQDTIFTKIIKGEIPCHKIYEDDNTIVFLDIHPVVEGHTLVVHKTPAQFVWDLSDEAYQQLMATTQKIAQHYRKVSGKPYVNMTVVGIDVPHNHVHVMPFTESKELSRLGLVGGEPDHEALAKVAEKLRLS